MGFRSRMDKYPKVSIGIATYNHSKYLAQCLDSVLHQTYPNIEVILIDDCSTDDTPIVLEQYHGQTHLRIHRNEKNNGIITTYNDLLNKATGVYFIVVGDDDALEQNYVEKMVCLMEENTKCRVALGSQHIMNENGVTENILNSHVVKYISGVHYLHDWFVKGKIVNHHSVIMSLMRKDDVVQAGGFPNFPMAQSADNALFMNVVKDGFVGIENSTCYKYRVYSNSYGNKHVKEVGKSCQMLVDYYCEHVQDYIVKIYGAKYADGIKKGMKRSLARLYYSRIARYDDVGGFKHTYELIQHFPNWMWKYLYIPKLAVRFFLKKLRRLYRK